MLHVSVRACGRAGQCRAGHGTNQAGQSRAGQSRAGQGRAGQGRAGQAERIDRAEQGQVQNPLDTVIIQLGFPGLIGHIIANALHHAKHRLVPDLHI